MPYLFSLSYSVPALDYDALILSVNVGGYAFEAATLKFNSLLLISWDGSLLATSLPALRIISLPVV